MKVVFVVIGVENLAVEFLSGFLNTHGHETDIVFDPRLFDNEAFHFSSLAKKFDILDEIAKQVVLKKPDLVGFPVFTLNYQRSLTIARQIKKHNRNLPIIFGGIHPTSVPEVVIKEKCVDMICVGEGEHALLELLESLSIGKIRTDIKNLWFKKGTKIIKNPCRLLIDNLDELPFPDKKKFYALYPGFKNDYYTVSSRGCPFSCTYCANNVLKKIYRGLGRPIRQRSPQNIIAELVLAKKIYAPKQITFADDVFVQDITWLKEFTREYKKKIGLPYTMLTHPSLITYPIAKLLAKSGCFLLAFGIQSASEKTRSEILNRYETNSQIRQAAKNCHRAGIKFSIDHIFNIPTEKKAEQEMALKLYNELRPSVINSYWLQYFPKTAILDTAVRTGLIKKSMISQINKGLTSTSFVVGFGGKDTFNPNLVFANFQFFFMLLPLLPKRLMGKIIDIKWYNLVFKPPIFLNILIKFFINLSQRRGYVYLDMIKTTLYFTRRVFAWKWYYKKVGITNT